MDTVTVPTSNAQEGNPKNSVFKEIAQILAESVQQFGLKSRQVRGGKVAMVIEGGELPDEARKALKQKIRQNDWSMDVASGEESAAYVPEDAASEQAEIDRLSKDLEKKRQALYVKYPSLRENAKYNEQAQELLQNAFKGMTGGRIVGGILETCSFFTGVKYRGEEEIEAPSGNGTEIVVE